MGGYQGAPGKRRETREDKNRKQDLVMVWIRRVREEGKHRSPSRFLD